MLSKTISIFWWISILGVVAALIYVITVPSPGEAFTEFYILDPSCKTVDYPIRLKVGEEGALTLSIVNREHETISYRVEIRIDGVIQSQLGPIVLIQGEKFEEAVSFTPEKAGKKQKVEFLLYNQKQSRIYDSLYLLVDVED